MYIFVEFVKFQGYENEIIKAGITRYETLWTSLNVSDAVGAFMS